MIAHEEWKAVCTLCAGQWPQLFKEDIMIETEHIAVEPVDQIEELESKIAPSGAAALLDYCVTKG